MSSEPGWPGLRPILYQSSPPARQWTSPGLALFIFTKDVPKSLLDRPTIIGDMVTLFLNAFNERGFCPLFKQFRTDLANVDWLPNPKSPCKAVETWFSNFNTMYILINSGNKTIMEVQYFVHQQQNYANIQVKWLNALPGTWYIEFWIRMNLHTYRRKDRMNSLWNCKLLLHKILRTFCFA